MTQFQSGLEYDEVETNSKAIWKWDRDINVSDQVSHPDLSSDSQGVEKKSEKR